MILSTRARLDACVFKGAVKNRATGKWEAVPMCSMNQAGWTCELYRPSGIQTEARQGPHQMSEVALLRFSTRSARFRSRFFCSITLTFGKFFLSASRKSRGFADDD